MTDWLTTLTAFDILMGLGGLGVLIGSLRWLIPILTGVRDFLTDWNGEPARPGVDRRPGVPERLATLDDTTQRNSTDIAAVRIQLESVTSLHAEVEKIRAEIAAFQDAVEVSIEDRKSLRERAEELQLEAAKLGRRVEALEQVAWPERVIPSGPIDNP